MWVRVSAFSPKHDRHFCYSVSLTRCTCFLKKKPLIVTSPFTTKQFSLKNYQIRSVCKDKTDQKYGVRSTNIIKTQRELLALPFYNTTVSDGCSHSALPLEIEEIPNTTCASQKPKKKKRLMGFHSPYLLLQFVCLGHLNDLHPGIFTTKTRIHSFFLSYF